MMKTKSPGLKRPRHPMPDFVKEALEVRGLADAYNERPDYQQNDYIGWINQAKRQATRTKRLAQMLDELERGGVYMKMAHAPSAKGNKKAKKTKTKTGKKGMELSTCCAWDGETLVLNILGSPSAKRDAIGKVKGKQLCISVTEKPVGGRATDHMVRFLAEEFDVNPKAITVVFGRYNVNKQLRIASPGKLPSVLARLSENEKIPTVT